MPSSEEFLSAFPFRTFSSLEALRLEKIEAPVHLGIGNYDGFHRGHCEIFNTAKLAAELDGGLVGALTFEPHPEVFFRGQEAVKLIYPLARKTELFRTAGLDFVIYEPFSEAIAGIHAAAFLDFLLEKIPTLRGIYVGDNFRFGAKRLGDVELLKKLGRDRGVEVSVVESVSYKGTRISSTRIRAALEAGEIEDVNAMLSSPYRTCGEIISGNRLGRTIGFPTLNLPWNPGLSPRLGAYFVKVHVPASGRSYWGIANYGVRPTLDRETPRPLLETHLTEVPAGVPVPTYGDFICVEWLAFLRPEMRFENFSALKRQLECDKKRAHHFFQNNDF